MPQKGVMHDRRRAQDSATLCDRMVYETMHTTEVVDLKLNSSQPFVIVVSILSSIIIQSIMTSTASNIIYDWMDYCNAMDNYRQVSYFYPVRNKKKKWSGLQLLQ